MNSCDVCGSKNTVVSRDTVTLREGAAPWIKHLCARCVIRLGAKEPEWAAH